MKEDTHSSTPMAQRRFLYVIAGTFSMKRMYIVLEETDAVEGKVGGGQHCLQSGTGFQYVA